MCLISWLTSIAHVASLTSLNNSEPCHPRFVVHATEPQHTLPQRVKRVYLETIGRGKWLFTVLFLDLSASVIVLTAHMFWALLLSFLASLRFLLDSQMRNSSDLKSNYYLHFEILIASHVLSLKLWKIIFISKPDDVFRMHGYFILLPAGISGHLTQKVLFLFSFMHPWVLFKLNSSLTFSSSSLPPSLLLFFLSLSLSLFFFCLTKLVYRTSLKDSNSRRKGIWILGFVMSV